MVALGVTAVVALGVIDVIVAFVTTDVIVAGNAVVRFCTVDVAVVTAGAGVVTNVV